LCSGVMACNGSAQSTSNVSADPANSRLTPQEGGFTQSCYNWGLTNSCDWNSYCNLGATCYDRQAHINPGAWTNLSNWITNDDGTMRWVNGYGNFAQTCSDLGINGLWINGQYTLTSQLAGTCKDRGWADRPARIDLDECIVNWDGNLNFGC
jgi:hypothetical protein